MGQSDGSRLIRSLRKPLSVQTATFTTRRALPCPGLILLFILSSSPLLWAQPSTAGKGGSFLRTQWSPRQAAMGDCGVASFDIEMAWHYNPALIAWQNQRTFALGYRPMSLDRTLIYLDFSSPLRAHGGVGIGLMRAATSEVEIRDDNGRILRTITLSDNLVHGTFGLKPAPFLALGISVKWAISSFPHLQLNDKNLTAYGIGVDLGAAIRGKKWSVGIKVADLGAHYNWDATQVWGDSYGAKDDPFPSTIRLGGVYQLEPYLALATELVADPSSLSKKADAYEWKAGGEFRYPFQEEYYIAFRIGFKGANPSAGLGLGLPLRKQSYLDWNLAYMFDRWGFSSGYFSGLRILF